MKTERWQALHAQATGSYVVQIDIRELESLCLAALNLRMLVDAVRLQAARVTILDEGKRFLDLVEGIPVIEGSLPEVPPCS